MRYVESKNNQTEEINIGPLIDLVFILLIFFAVSTTFTKDMNLELERPSASQAEIASTKAIRVHLDRGGNIYVEEQPVKPYLLEGRMRDLLARSSSRQVLVVADRLVAADRLIQVVDQCKAGGASEVGVATELP